MKTERYIVHECIGCNKVENSLCKTYINPSTWFRNGKRCPTASHIKTAPETPLQKKIRIGQQKHKKDRR